MVRSASAALSDLSYSFTAGTLTIDDMSFVEKLKKAKLLIQNKFRVAINFKKTRATLKNGSEETYCEILSNVLRCDHISIDTFREHMTLSSSVRMPKALGKFAASWNPHPCSQVQTPAEPECPTNANRRVITLECDEETSPASDFPLPPPINIPVPDEKEPSLVEGELVTDEWRRFDTEAVRAEAPTVQRQTVCIPVPVLESQSCGRQYAPSKWRGSEAAEMTSYGMYYGFRPIVDVPVRTETVPATFKPVRIEMARNESDECGRVGQQAIPVEKFAAFSHGATIGTFSDDCLKDMEHRPRRDGESQPAREPVRSVSLDFGTSRDGRQGVTVKDKVVTVAGEKGDALLLKQRILRALDIPCDTPVRALVFT